MSSLIERLGVKTQTEDARKEDNPQEVKFKALLSSTLAEAAGKVGTEQVEKSSQIAY